MQLCDRADGVKGHYAIGRFNFDGKYWEYWTEHCQQFTSAGTLYVGEQVALSKLNLLHQQQVKLKDRFTAGLSCQVARIQELEEELEEYKTRCAAMEIFKDKIADLKWDIDNHRHRARTLETANVKMFEELKTLAKGVLMEGCVIDYSMFEFQECKRLANEVLER